MTEKRVRRVEPAEVRRAQIIEAAKGRFCEAGFHPTKMADVAEAAGLSVGLLYRYFPSKEAIIRAIVEEDLQAQLGAMESALEAHPDDQAAALNALVAAFAELASNRTRTTLMLEIAAELARSQSLWALAGEFEGVMEQRLAKRFAKTLPADEANMRVRLMWSLFSGMGLQVYRDPSHKMLAMRLTAETAKHLLATRS